MVVFGTLGRSPYVAVILSGQRPMVASAYTNEGGEARDRMHHLFSTWSERLW